MVEESAFTRFMEIFVNHVIASSDYMDSMDGRAILGVIRADEEIYAVFLRCLKQYLRHNHDPQDRLIMAEVVVDEVDQQLARRQAKRGAMQEFVLQLVGRSSSLADDLQEAKELLTRQGFKRKEIRDREKRFRSWLKGE